MARKRHSKRRDRRPRKSPGGAFEGPGRPGDSPVPPETLQRLYQRLEGTCDGIDRALESLGLNPVDYADDEVEDQLCGAGLELCPGCGWWFESGELIDDDNEVVGCEDCRREG